LGQGNARKKVMMLVGGYPTKENPARCIFNQRGAQELTKQNDVTVVFLRLWKPGTRFVSTTKEAVHTVIQLRLPFLPTLNWMKVIMFAVIGPKIISKEIRKTDIIHSVSAHSISIIGSFWAKKFNKKHVAQIIGSDINSVMPVIRNKWYVKHWTDNVHAISANSAALKQAFNELYPSFTRQVYVIYRGVDIDLFKPSVKNADTTNFLFLGGIPEYSNLPFGRNTKGGVTLMKIWKRVEKYAAQHKCQLLFGGPSSYTQEVIDWHNQLEFPETVKLIGHINPLEVVKLITQSHAIIIPSREEGMPNVGVEALASGCAILANRVGGLPELVQPGLNGILFDADDELGWSKEIIGLMKNKSSLLKMGKTSRTVAIKQFNKAHFSEKLTEIYQSI